jgi:hypothetical protein
VNANSQLAHFIPFITGEKVVCTYWIGGCVFTRAELQTRPSIIKTYLADDQSHHKIDVHWLMQFKGTEMNTGTSVRCFYIFLLVK